MPLSEPLCTLCMLKGGQDEPGLPGGGPCFCATPLVVFAAPHRPACVEVPVPASLRLREPALG